MRFLHPPVTLEERLVAGLKGLIPGVGQAVVSLEINPGEGIRREAELPLYHLFLAGGITRGEFKQMTSLGARTADSLLAALLKVGLVESDTSRAPLRFGLPLEALAYYFPRLYPEAAA